MKKLFSIFLIPIILSCAAACSQENVSQPSVGKSIQNEQIAPPAAEGKKEEFKKPETVPLNPDVSSNFEVHFIDVGQADAALVLCDGKAMLIDGGNAEDSDLIYTYLKKLSVTFLDAAVCTHADEDHVGGLSGALSYAKAAKIYAPHTSSNSKAYQNFIKKANDCGVNLVCPSPGDSFSLGSSKVTVLGPVTENYEDRNNTSIVLKVVYNDTSFLFTGDAEKEAEHDIMEKGFNLKADVLKAGHHGSDSSSSYVFLREVMPRYVVISVGKGNSYGHPHENTLSRFRDVGATVIRTDLQGNIICKSDGKNISFTTEKNLTDSTVSSEKNIPAQGGEGYIGNINSKKFHRNSCNNLPAENNRIFFSSREDAVANGYEPCKKCKP